MKNHPISVRLVDGKHVCTPTESEVKPGDTVFWDGKEPMLVFFSHGSPFVEGNGPFSNGQQVTVGKKPPLHGGEVFVPTIALDSKVRPTVGGIKVT